MNAAERAQKLNWGHDVSDSVLIRHGDQWLALCAEDYQEALKLGNILGPGINEPPAKNDSDKPVWLSVPQVARLCNVSETYLRDEIRLNKIRARRFGRSVRIHRDFVEHQTSHLYGGDDGEQ